jgi:uncharacterized protein
MLYLDTSLVVTLLTSEPATEKARAWMREHQEQRFLISDWVAVEFSAALSMKARGGFLTLEQRDATQAWFNRLSSESFERLPIGTEHFLQASRFAQRSTVGLRGGDALHLAIAAAALATLCTRDHALAQAAEEFGLATELL